MPNVMGSATLSCFNIWAPCTKEEGFIYALVVAVQCFQVNSRSRVALLIGL